MFQYVLNYINQSIDVEGGIHGLHVCGEDDGDLGAELLVDLLDPGDHLLSAAAHGPELVINGPG